MKYLFILYDLLVGSMIESFVPSVPISIALITIVVLVGCTIYYKRLGVEETSITDLKPSYLA